MDFRIGIESVQDRKKVTSLIHTLFEKSGQSNEFLRKYDQGAVLLKEGDELKDIFIPQPHHVKFSSILITCIFCYNRPSYQ